MYVCYLNRIRGKWPAHCFSIGERQCYDLDWEDNPGFDPILPGMSTVPIYKIEVVQYTEECEDDEVCQAKLATFPAVVGSFPVALLMHMLRDLGVWHQNQIQH